MRGENSCIVKTYVSFVVLSVIGTSLGFCMLSAKAVRRHDGSRVHLASNDTIILTNLDRAAF
jgi:hypothetical protein